MTKPETTALMDEASTVIVLTREIEKVVAGKPVHVGLNALLSAYAHIARSHGLGGEAGPVLIQVGSQMLIELMAAPVSPPPGSKVH